MELERVLATMPKPKLNVVKKKVKKVRAYDRQEDGAEILYQIAKDLKDRKVPSFVIMYNDDAGGFHTQNWLRGTDSDQFVTGAFGWAMKQIRDREV